MYVILGQFAIVDSHGFVIQNKLRTEVLSFHIKKCRQRKNVCVAVVITDRTKSGKLCENGQMATLPV